MTQLEEVVHNSKKLRPRTKAIYLDAVQSFIAFAGNNPNRWSGLEVEKWQAKELAHVKPQTANLHLAGLRYACKRLSQLTQDARYNFAYAVEASKPEQSKKRRALSQTQVFALLGTCEEGRPIDIRDRAMMTLGFRTGLRRDGISNVRFEDCENGGITVTLKGGRKHVIYPDKIVWETVGAWTDWLNMQGVQSGKLFRSVGRVRIDGSYHVGSAMTPGAIYMVLKKRSHTVGLRAVSPHIMRHTFVSWCKELKIADYRIKAMTGHRANHMLDLYTTDLEAQSQPIGEALPWMSK